MKVLIADDNEDAADMLAILVKTLGHQVEIAYNGREALTKAIQFDPDVAVLDIAMPNLTGIEVARMMRRRGMPTRLIALTGHGYAAMQARVLEAGFELFLIKPVDVETIKLAINRGIARSRRAWRRPNTNGSEK